MSKRIVVGLDPSKHCKTAIELACERAKLYDGTVVGVGVVDLPGIESASHGAGVGASHFAKKAREKHIREAKQTVEGLIADFEKTCEKRGVRFETEYKAGDPVDELVDAGKSADLIVIGTRTFFKFETQEAPADTLQDLLKEKVCPVLAVPEDLTLPFKYAIFPYDGSVKAARSMRSFVNLTCELPIAPDVILLRIEEDVDEGLAELKRPAQYLEAYGYNVKKEVVPGDARDVIKEFALSHQPAIVVLGVSGKSTLRAFIFGSVTRTLIEDGSIPMFVSS